MRSYKTLALIIKRTNFSEADRILTIFTKDYGKIKVLAKGVRKITSKRGGNVELLNLAEITLHEGKNFDLLTEAQVISSFPDLRTNLIKIGLCYHLCEIVDGLCPERQENRKIFDEFVKTLFLLNSQPVYPEKRRVTCNMSTINFFETFIIKELGFWSKDKELPVNKIDGILEDLLEKTLKSKNFLAKIS